MFFVHLIHSHEVENAKGDSGMLSEPLSTPYARFELADDAGRKRARMKAKIG